MGWLLRDDPGVRPVSDDGPPAGRASYPRGLSAKSGKKSPGGVVPGAAGGAGWPADVAGWPIYRLDPLARLGQGQGGVLQRSLAGDGLDALEREVVGFPDDDQCPLWSVV